MAEVAGGNCDANVPPTVVLAGGALVVAVAVVVWTSGGFCLGGGFSFERFLCPLCVTGGGDAVDSATVT